MPDIEHCNLVHVWKPASVSVIILTFNSEKYISRCLDALVAQLYRDLEILIVDAGSKDMTLSLIDGYRSKLDIRVIDAPGTNMGQARNIGIRNARGNFLCFCDADDYFLPAKIEIQINFLCGHPEYAACYYDAFHFQSDSPEQIYWVRKPVGKSGCLISNFIRAQTININTLMIRRFLGGHDAVFPDDAAGKYAEDWQYLINLGLQGTTFGWIDGSYSMIEVRTDSHTTWGIQHLMKWYVLKHLLASHDAISSMGVSRLTLWKCYFFHYLKFVAACCVSGNAGYVYRSRFGNSMIESMFLFVYRPFSSSIFERPSFQKLLQWLWMTRRQRKIQSAVSS